MTEPAMLVLDDVPEELEELRRCTPPVWAGVRGHLREFDGCGVGSSHRHPRYEGATRDWKKVRIERSTTARPPNTARTAFAAASG